MKKYLIIIAFLLVSLNVFAVTPPSNKSVNGIITWVDDNFVATDSWTASGSTQIYTEKSVGIGTSTPDVDNSIDVYSKDETGHLYLRDSEFGWLDSNDVNNYLYTDIYGITHTRIAQIHYAIYCDHLWDNIYRQTKLDLSQTQMVFTTHNLEAMRITDNQNLCIGTTVDDGVNKVQVNGGVKVSGLFNCEYTDGNAKDIKLLTNNSADNEYRFKIVNGSYYTKFGEYLGRSNNSNQEWTFNAPYINLPIKVKLGTYNRDQIYTNDGDYNLKFETYDGSTQKICVTMTDNQNLVIATTTDRLQSEELQVNGHAYVKNYVKQANSMAMIDMTENTTGQVIPVSTDWTELTFTDGDDHYDVGDCIASATNNCIQILATGVYDIRVESSFYCNDRSTQWKFNALVDGEKSHAGFIRFTSNSNDVGCAMGSGIVVVATAPAIITVGVQHNESSTSTLTCYRTALIVKYLGEIQ